MTDTRWVSERIGLRVVFTEWLVDLGAGRAMPTGGRVVVGCWTWIRMRFLLWLLGNRHEAVRVFAAERWYRTRARIGGDPVGTRLLLGAGRHRPLEAS